MQVEANILAYIHGVAHGELVYDQAEAQRVCDLCASAVDTLQVVSTRLARFLESFALFYADFCALASQILHDGIVRPPPRADERNADGEGPTSTTGDASGEASGMGEGAGERDVGAEIEETGQLEGLEGENEEAQGADENANKNDVETPIDMEEDFAAELEGLDAEEADESKRASVY